MKLLTNLFPLLLLLPLLAACDSVNCVSDDNGLVCEAEGSYNGRLARTTGTPLTCSDGSESNIEIDPRDIRASVVLLDEEEKLFEITLANCTYVGNVESDSSIVLYPVGASSSDESCGDSLRFTKTDESTVLIEITGIKIELDGLSCLVDESGTFTRTVSVEQQEHS